MAALVVALLQPEVACLDPLIHRAIVFRPCRYGDPGPNAYFAANLFPGITMSELYFDNYDTGLTQT